MKCLWMSIAIWLFVISFCETHRLPRHENNTDFAKKYLYQHGYLNCSISSLKSGVCSSESWQKAIKMFQNNFKLQATGYLDQKTLEKMMVKRCSNEDEHNSIKRKMIEKHSKRRKRDAASTKGISTFEMFKSLHEDHCQGVECIQPVEAMYDDGLPDHGQRFYDSRTTSPIRGKRSVNGRKVILWSFSNSTEVTLNYKVAVLYAHKSWSEVIPLKFYNTRRSDIADVEYTIKKGAFKSYVKQSKRKTEVHINLSGDESIEDILIHSLGHYLGLTHIMDNQSVMYPLFENAYLEIGRQDQKLGQTLHGKCSGRFDLATNWLVNNASEYVTIFTRNEYCWVYSHALLRTLRGAESFCFFPIKVDAAIQFFKSDGSLESFAFEGPMYYKYDELSVKSGYPKGLEDFSCQTKEGPKQVDAAFSDSQFVYLFYDRKVWLYNKETFARGVCPLYVLNLSDIFYPATPRDSFDGPLDSMFRSYFFNAVLIFRGDELYAARQFTVLSKLPRFEIKKIGPWNDIYDNICEDE